MSFNSILKSLFTSTETKTSKLASTTKSSPTPYPVPSLVGEGWGEGKMTAPLSDGLNPITDNRLKAYNGTSYYYDHFGNLIHRELADGEVQNYFYDLHDQLVKAEIFKKDGSKETCSYT